MRRLLKNCALAAGGVLLLVAALGGAVLLAGNTDWGRVQIERLTHHLTGGYVTLTGLAGSLPSAPTLRHLELRDAGGVWLSADGLAVQWSPLAWLERRIQVDRLQAVRVHMERTPVSGSHGGSVSIPHIEVGSFSIDAVELGAPLVGTPASLSVHGKVELRSLEDAAADVVARRLDGDGAYVAHLRFDRKRMEASLSVHEPSGGPLEQLLAVPGLGALSATMTLQGPRSAERVDAQVDAGDLHGQANGSIDVVHETADLTYSLTAPALSLRPDVSWTHVALHGTWRGSLTAPVADGRLDVDGLRLAGTLQIRQVQATLAGSAGKLAVRGVVNGLELPGSQPRLLAADPVQFDASLQLNAPLRPLELTASHPLFKLHAHAATHSTNSGPLRAAIELTLPEIAPFAAYAAQDVRGKALINAQAEFDRGSGSLKLDADVGLAGGTAVWIDAVGPRLRVQLAGSLSNDAITLQRLLMDGRVMTLAASGRAVLADGTSPAAGFIKTLQSRWQLDISDLGALSSDLAGTLKASGHLSGSLASLAGDADSSARLSVRGSPAGVVDASLQVHGLPRAPGGALQAHGMVDGAPLNVDAVVDRGGSDELRLLVRHADWKSAHLEGDLSTDGGMTHSHGQLQLHVGQLGDFDRLLGMSVAGGVEGTLGIVPAGEHVQAHLQLDGKDLVAGQFAGTVQLQGNGVLDDFELALTAQLPKFHGHPARVQTTATLNLDSRALRVSDIAVGYRGETFRLLAPAQISLQKELSVDDLRIGARDAVLDIKGELAPALDVRASLEKLNPDLVNAFNPGLLASGTIEARARLEGTLASPTGTLRLDATGVQFADESATGLPAADLHARAQLAGDSAAVNVKLTGGSGSQLTLSGTAPLDANGDVDLKFGGKLDVGLASPLLEARGLRATGQLTVDASVTGTAAAPQVGGNITLAGGSVRDFARGVNISDINAVVVGSEGALQIKSFTAKAAQGTMTVSGSFGVLQAGMPIDLKIRAKNAQPIASNIVTANLDADLQVSGSARQRIDVSGTIHVNRATIGIPDSLPPDVAVLDVRRRGQGAPVAVETQLVIGLDVTVQAPQQILVQGRGLDAELGGDIHISGTTDNPVATGKFDLQRGTFTIAGSRLDFTPPGGVSFDGAGLAKKIDPTLDFTATTVLPTSTATLHISGPADAPRFDFSSTTQQSADEIMAQLLFGENASQLSALQAAQIGWALASLTGVGGSGLNPLVKLQKTLGLDRLTVASNTTTTATGATENSGAAIAAGRYISKRVYIEGRQSNTGTSQVQVDVDLTKHLKLQTRLGNGTASTQGTTPENDPGSSVGLSYQFEY